MRIERTLFLVRSQVPYPLGDEDKLQFWLRFTANLTLNVCELCQSLWRDSDPHRMV